MTSIREKRKWDHIKKTIEAGNKRCDYFDDVLLLPDSSSTVSFDKTDLQCMFFNKKLSAPLLINAMTGGAKGLEKYNEAFAIAARENNIAMAVGSQKAGIINADLIDTYTIARKINPEGLLFANLSALENIETMKRAVSMIKADAIQLHVNHAQELSMEEGDRDFTELLKNVEKAVNGLDVPVIIKDVGTGLSKKAVETFKNIGVLHFDVGGYGGTNFPAIEENRMHKDRSALSDIGIPTPVSILEVRNAKPSGYVFAAGGIMDAAQIVKSIALGADAAAMAGALLLYHEKFGTELLSDKISDTIIEMKKIFIILGIRNLSECKQLDYVLKNEVREWVQQRIPTTRAL
jgi:isopentenyl-diphosphate Delta-isomerase